MRGLYGVQPRYLPDVLRQGFCRESAAFFGIPEDPQQETLRVTLACAVFHAIGLSALDEAARTGRTVARILESRGLAFVWMEDIPDRQTRWDHYRIGLLTTYPYTKVQTFGPVHTGKMSVMDLDSRFLDIPIAAPDAPAQPRFFQKDDGKPQALSGVDMEALEQMCLQAADHLIAVYGLTKEFKL